jgi:dolichol kinase
LPKQAVIFPLLFILALLLLLDFARYYKLGFADKFKFLFKKEEKAISSASFLLLGLVVVLNSFEKEVAILSVCIALIYDFFSYLGTFSGKIRFRGKSLEGCVLGAILGYATGWLVNTMLGLDYNVLLSAVIAAPVTELFLDWPDDNFTIPFFTAVAAQFVKNSF